MLYQRVIRSLFFLLPAEIAHKVGFGAWRLICAIPLVSGLISRYFAQTPHNLQTTAFGRALASPIGLAAGFDKNGSGFKALGRMGFAFIEVGTVTPRPQPGNPRPRLFRLRADRALINRMGFNNVGAVAVAKRLRRKGDCFIGVNIGKNKDTPNEQAVEDYKACAKTLLPYADYLVINVSSPNTPGLRKLQAVEQLRPVLSSVNQLATEKKCPVLLKIAPDLSDAEIRDIAKLAIETQIAGIIATNTSLSRDGLTTNQKALGNIGPGGLSGKPLKTRAIEVLRVLRETAGDKLVLVSCGGIETAEDIAQRLKAGATLVQIYTALIYEGPGLLRKLHSELSEKIGTLPKGPRSLTVQQ
ncbi:MAG: quinone-dependent dihydroorotate dehydrogenase [Myxococcales bacterium]|nr:MAG: quinone-dependent dihydroorotate dehydrogenase [Myxococcales bacterium]